MKQIMNWNAVAFWVVAVALMPGYTILAVWRAISHAASKR